MTTTAPSPTPPANATGRGFLAGPADTAKLVGALLVFASVLLFTLVPALVVRSVQRARRRSKSGSGPAAAEKERRRRRRRLASMRLISCFNCFAAGVFVSTGLMDVLPDAMEDLAEGVAALGLTIDFPLAPFFMLVGFFLMLGIEQAVMCCSDRHSHGPGHRSGRASPRNPVAGDEWRHSAAAINGKDSASLAPRKDDDDEEETLALRPMDRATSASLEGVRFPSHAWEGDREREDDTREEAIGHSHVSEAMMSRAGSPVRTVFLVGAMSVHALFEGLALGLRRSSTQIYQLLAAICMHKSLIAMGIGLSLGQTRAVRRGLVAVCSLIFAGMSPLGTLVGMALTYAARQGGGAASLGRKFPFLSGSLQGMACGTFLYVTFFEVLPREINEATRPRQRALYLASLIAGFAAMCLFIWWAR